MRKQWLRGLAAAAGLALAATMAVATPAHAAPAQFGTWYFVWAAGNGTSNEMGTTSMCRDNPGCWVINADTHNEHEPLEYTTSVETWSQLLTYNNGNCVSWNDAHQQVELQTCKYDVYGNPATWQLWASDGHYQDQLWNEYFQNLRGSCWTTWGGWEPAVMTAYQSNQIIGLACPDGMSGYDAYQGWIRLTAG